MIGFIRLANLFYYVVASSTSLLLLFVFCAPEFAQRLLPDDGRWLLIPWFILFVAMALKLTSDLLCSPRQLMLWLMVPMIWLGTVMAFSEFVYPAFFG